jgi:hypothetical protein
MKIKRFSWVVRVLWTCRCGKENVWMAEYVSYLDCRDPKCVFCYTQFYMVYSPIECLICGKGCELSKILLIDAPASEWSYKGPITFHAKWLYLEE